MSKKPKKLYVVNVLMAGIFVSFFKLADMRPLLDIKERYTRTKGKKKRNKKGKAWSYYTLQLLKQILFTVSKSSVSPLQLCSKTNDCCGLCDAKFIEDG